MPRKYDIHNSLMYSLNAEHQTFQITLHGYLIKTKTLTPSKVISRHYHRFSLLSGVRGESSGISLNALLLGAAVDRLRPLVCAVRSVEPI